MDLNAWQKNWDELGKNDPLWLVLGNRPGGGQWGAEEFFQAGRDEIRNVFAELDGLLVSVRRSRALDFGCGVGRLCQALAETFEEVHGVDISPSMIEHARRFNRFPDRCKYHVSAENGLPMFPSDHFDFVYSVLTLQHIEPRFARNYLREFVRVTRPGGVMAFQVLKPVLWRGLVPQRAAEAWRRFKHGRKPYIGMFGMSGREVTRAVEAAGAKVIQVSPLPCDTSRFLSYKYFATKTSPS